MNTMLTKIAAIATIALVPFVATTASGSAQTIDPNQGACERPNVAASTLVARLPEASTIAAPLHLTGTAFVQVDLDETGTILDATIAKSSGEYLLDQAALQAARASTFQPELRNCKPVPGAYLYVVDFPA